MYMLLHQTNMTFFIVIFTYSELFINWKYRCWTRSEVRNVFFSIDETDFETHDSLPFIPRWVSHKFQGSGLHYNIGTCLIAGKIIWAVGPFPCGTCADLNLHKVFGTTFQSMWALSRQQPICLQ